MTDKNIIEGALNGNKECCYILGEKYYYGRGTGKNTELAKEWYGEAARLGHSSAQYMYGYMLCSAARGEKDLREGLKYVKKAANKLHTGAMLLLARNYFYGVGVGKSEKKAFRVWKKAAEIGCPEAKYYLGLCYDKGVTVRRDVIKAKRYLFDALENGYDASKTILLRSGYPLAA
jgi:TPR repeat protein